MKPLVDGLELLRSTRIVTGRFATWEAAHGVPVRITVGEPKFWRGPPLVDGRILAPFGLLDPSIPTDECRRLYHERLDDRADWIVAVVARIATEHRARPCGCSASRTSARRGAIDVGSERGGRTDSGWLCQR